MTDRLLNTSEAAVYLRVSEASIRRWSDAGELPGRRVGGRRERRFSEADLVRFLNRGAVGQTGQSRSAATVNVGGVMATVPAHLAVFHSSDAGALRLTVPFLADGLRAGQPCFLVADDGLAALYRALLSREPGIDLKRSIKNGLFEAGMFAGDSAADALGHWESYFARVLAAGPTIIRIVGELRSERKGFSSDEEMMRYEAAFDLMARRYPVAVICQYDVREFDGLTVLTALKTHPDLFDLRLGAFLT